MIVFYQHCNQPIGGIIAALCVRSHSKAMLLFFIFKLSMHHICWGFLAYMESVGFCVFIHTSNISIFTAPVFLWHSEIDPWTKGYSEGPNGLINCCGVWWCLLERTRTCAVCRGRALASRVQLRACVLACARNTQALISVQLLVFFPVEQQSEAFSAKSFGE